MLFRISGLLLGALLATAPSYAGDDAPSGGRRYKVGVRVQSFPFRLFEVQEVSTTTTNPVAEYAYTATTSSQKAAPAPSLEYRLTGRLTVGFDFMLHHANYIQKSEMLSGRKDPNAATDDRQPTTVTETSRANYWEIPVLFRYYGLRESGLLSKAYVVGGLGLRHVGRVRTGTEHDNADGTTDYDEVSTEPERRRQVGAVIGIGLRFADDFGVTMMPEVRLTRWRGNTFQGPAFRSAGNEITAGLGISF